MAHGQDPGPLAGAEGLQVLQRQAPTIARRHGWSRAMLDHLARSVLAPTYAPDVNRRLVGAAEGGVLVRPSANLDYVSDSLVWAGVMPMAIIGVSRAYDIDLTPYLSDYGLSLHKKMENDSIAQVLGAYPGLTWEQLTRPEYADPASVPEFVTSVNKLNLGTRPSPTIPMLIGQGARGEFEGTAGNRPGIGPGDGVMIAGDVRSLARQYCADGVRLTHREYPLSHVTAPEVYWDYCGPHMICMERMTGVPMDQFDAIREMGADGEPVADAPDALEVVSCGVPFPGHELDIVLVVEARVVHVRRGQVSLAAQDALGERRALVRRMCLGAHDELRGLRPPPLGELCNRLLEDDLVRHMEELLFYRSAPALSSTDFHSSSAVCERVSAMRSPASTRRLTTWPASNSVKPHSAARSAMLRSASTLHSSAHSFGPRATSSEGGPDDRPGTDAATRFAIAVT